MIVSELLLWRFWRQTVRNGKCILLIALGLCFPAMLAACGTLAYIPDKATTEKIPLSIALDNASDAITQASLLYDESHLSKADDIYLLRLTGFQLSSDGKRASAAYIVNGTSQSCTEPVDWWLGSGPHTGGIYLAGSMPFPDSSQIGGKYCMTMNLIFSDCNFRFICWKYQDLAERFVDAMTTISTAAGPDFAQTLLASELLPDDYPAAKSFPTAATPDSSDARGLIRTGRTDEAIASIRKSLASAPEWPAGHYNLAILLSQEAKYSQAANEMNTYLALLPSAPNAAAAEKLVSKWQSGQAATQH